MARAQAPARERQAVAQASSRARSAISTAAYRKPCLRALDDASGLRLAVDRRIYSHRTQTILPKKGILHRLAVAGRNVNLNLGLGVERRKRLASLVDAGEPLVQFREPFADGAHVLAAVAEIANNAVDVLSE